MVRRRFSDEPISRLAIWARRLAVFAFVASVLSVIIVRSGLLEIVPALATFGGALALAVLAILLAFAAFVVISISIAITGAFTAETLKLYGLGLPFLLAGLWSGFKLYGKIDDEMFRKVVLLLLLLAGLSLIVPAVRAAS